MIRKEAMRLILAKINSEPIVSANGFISRDLFELKDKPSNFYMIGSMGLASSIGLGVALTTVAALKPKNFIHIIFDNASHESTGGQPTVTSKIRIKNIAKSLNYKVFEVKTKNEIENFFRKISSTVGPIMLIVKVQKSIIVSKRIDISPTKIKNRFIDSLKN